MNCSSHLHIRGLPAPWLELLVVIALFAFALNAVAQGPYPYRKEAVQ
jgi:hypothetical protein